MDRETEWGVRPLLTPWPLTESKMAGSPLWHGAAVPIKGDGSEDKVEFGCVDAGRGDER